MLAVLYNPTVIGLALEIEDLTLYGSPGIGFTHQSEIYSPLLRPAADGKAADMAPGSHGARSAEPDGQVGGRRWPLGQQRPSDPVSSSAVSHRLAVRPTGCLGDFHNSIVA